MEPLQPKLQVYPSELRKQLRTAERKLVLQDRYIAETGAQLALTQHLNTIS